MRGREGVGPGGPGWRFGSGSACPGGTTSTARPESALVTHLPGTSPRDGPAPPRPASCQARSLRGLYLALLRTAGLFCRCSLAIWTVPGFRDPGRPDAPVQRVDPRRFVLGAWFALRALLPGPLAAPAELGRAISRSRVSFRVVSPWTADRIMMTVTLLGLRLASIWLRWTSLRRATASGRPACWPPCSR